MKTKRLLALLLAVAMMFTMIVPMAFATGEANNDPAWPNEGAIQLNKTASAVEGETNQWEVTLTIEGKNYKTTSDVVLVIDNSNSMYPSESNGYVDRMTKAKAAAKAFAKELLKEGSTTRIAVVVYCLAGHTEKTDFYTYETIDGFNSYIDSIQQNEDYGGTNTQEGLHAADEILSSPDSTGKMKSIVLLSDGEPTQSYMWTATGTLVGCSQQGYWHQDWNGQLSNIQYTGFNYARTSGDGTQYTTTNNVTVSWTCQHGESGTKNATSPNRNHGDATIEEARLIKEKGTTIYSVAFQAGANGQSVLESCATDSTRGYYAISSEEIDVEGKLKEAFLAIAGQIAIAASQGKVTDPMGDDVDIVFSGSAPTFTTDKSVYDAGGADVYISQGDATYAGDTETINWNVGNVNEGTPVTMKYRVKLDPSKNFSTGATLPTNKKTTFEYKNYLGNDAAKDFPLPTVTVGGGTILKHYYLVNANGQPINEAGVEVDRPDLAYQVKEAAYHTVNGSAGLAYDTYSVKKESVADYRYYGAILNDGDMAKDAEEVTVALSSANSAQDVWFAYYQVQVFQVTYIPINEGEANATERRTETYDVTSDFTVTDKLDTGYLYGGLYEEEPTGTAGALVWNGETGAYDGTKGNGEDGFNPEPDAHYYVKEVPTSYLQPRNYYMYDRNSTPKNELKRMYLVTAVDDLNYQEVGFDVEKVAPNASAEKENAQATICETVHVEQRISWATTETTTFDLTLNDFFAAYKLENGDGYIGIAYYQDGVGKNIEFNFKPYFITPDGVKVSPATRNVKTGENGCVEDLEITGNEKEVGKIYEAQPTTSTSATTLSLFSTYSISDEEPTVPEEETDKEVTITTIINGNSNEWTADAGDCTGIVPDPSEEQPGKVFVGWFTEDGEAADFSDVQEDLTIYAKYIPTKSVRLNVTTSKGRSGVVNVTASLSLPGVKVAEVGFLTDDGYEQADSYKGSSYRASWTTSASSNTVTVTPYWVTLDGTTVYGEPGTYRIRSNNSSLWGF